MYIIAPNTNFINYYEAPRIFYTPNYYDLQKWADAEKLTLLHAVNIINYRMKHKINEN